MTSKDKSREGASSGNVYKDLGFDDPELMLLKAGLAREIHKIMKKRKLNQTQAGEIMGIDQPKVSKLIRGLVSGYSLDRLFEFLRSLSADINVVINTRVLTQKKAPVKRSGKSRFVASKKGHLNLESTDASLVPSENKTSSSRLQGV